jgi:putative membrane protein
MQRTTTIIVAAALAVLVLVAIPALAFAIGLAGMPMPGSSWSAPMHDGGFQMTTPIWFAVLGVLSQFAFFALFAAGAYVLYRAVTRDSSDTALEELRRAYARGDVDDDEYERRRERLTDDQ